MNQFIEECRREWKRLRVPGPVANEMAADLAADLEEAESEGASPEEVLGSGASDPRSFAASWAAERGVIPPPRLRDRLSRRALLLAAAAVLTTIAAIGAALVILWSPHESARPLPPALAGPVDQRVTIIGPPPFGVEAKGSGVDIHTLGEILLIVGIAGIIVSLLSLFWSSRARPGVWPRSA